MSIRACSCYVFFFFFSSRRRHTRFDCDWSSDVCSSDLMALELTASLVAELRRLEAALRRLAVRERRVVKPGRTHLQDAVPITYGQVFTGWAHACREAAQAGGTRSRALPVTRLSRPAAGNRADP